MDCESRRADGQFSVQCLSKTVLTEHRNDASSSGDIPLLFEFGVPFKAAPARGKTYQGKPFIDLGDDDSQGKIGIRKIITSKAKSWKGSKLGSSIVRTIHGVWPCSNLDQGNDFGQQRSLDINLLSELQDEENNRFVNEASCSPSSSCNVSSTSSDIGTLARRT